MLQPRGTKTARPLRRAELLHLVGRFEAHVHHEPNTGCWLWDASQTEHGYGQIRGGGRLTPKLLAHRVAYALERGELEAGADLLHSCDTPWCVNPAHLRTGSATDNNEDMDRRDRRVRGDRHPYFGRGPQPTLTPHQREQLRARLRAGERVCDLARAFGVTQRHVHRLKGATP